MKHIVFNSVQEIAEASANLITGPNVAVSGGSTYREIFSYWSAIPGISKYAFFPVDERRVPFEDINCNWRMTSELLFDPLGISQQKEHWAKIPNDYQDLISFAKSRTVPASSILSCNVTMTVFVTIVA